MKRLVLLGFLVFFATFGVGYAQDSCVGDAHESERFKRQSRVRRYAATYASAWSNGEVLSSEIFYVEDTFAVGD